MHDDDFQEFLEQRIEETRGPIGGWTAMAELLSRPWFQRSWITQEVAFGRDVTVTCGGDLIPWDDMDTAASYILKSQSVDSLVTGLCGV
jgi:hypothetical protein